MVSPTSAFEAGIRNASSKVFILLSMSPEPDLIKEPGMSGRRNKTSKSHSKDSSSVTKGTNRYPIRVNWLARASERVGEPMISCGFRASRRCGVSFQSRCSWRCKTLRISCLCLGLLFLFEAASRRPSYVNRNSNETSQPRHQSSSNEPCRERPPAHLSVHG